MQQACSQTLNFANLFGSSLKSCACQPQFLLRGAKLSSQLVNMTRIRKIWTVHFYRGELDNTLLRFAPIMSAA
jgi:hypothetical protein